MGNKIYYRIFAAQKQQLWYKNLAYPSSQSAIQNARTNINENNKSTFHTCSRDKQQDEDVILYSSFHDL